MADPNSSKPLGASALERSLGALPSPKADARLQVPAIGEEDLTGAILQLLSTGVP